MQVHVDTSRLNLEVSEMRNQGMAVVGGRKQEVG